MDGSFLPGPQLWSTAAQTAGVTRWRTGCCGLPGVATAHSRQHPRQHPQLPAHVCASEAAPQPWGLESSLWSSTFPGSSARGTAHRSQSLPSGGHPHSPRWPASPWPGWPGWGRAGLTSGREADSQGMLCSHSFVLTGHRGRPGPGRRACEGQPGSAVSRGGGTWPCSTHTLRHGKRSGDRLRGAGFPAHRWRESLSFAPRR